MVQKLPFYKQQLVSCIPEINYMVLDDSCQAIVVACDGLFDVMSSGDIAKIVQENMPKFMIRAIEQIAIKNIERCVPEYYDELHGENINYFSRLLRALQKSFAKLKFSMMHEVEQYRLPNELL